MLRSRFLLPLIALTVFRSPADAQLRIHRVANFGSPSKDARQFAGGCEVEFTSDGKKMIAAFFDSTVQLFDLIRNLPIGKPIGTWNPFGKSKFRQVVTTSTFTQLTVSILSFATSKKILVSTKLQMGERSGINPAWKDPASPKKTVALCKSDGVEIWEKE